MTALPASRHRPACRGVGTRRTGVIRRASPGARRTRGDAPWPARRHRRPARGLGAIAVVLLLVMLSAMAAAVLRLSVQSNTAMQQDLQATRAAAAARSGLDWALWQVLKGGWGTACATAATSQTLDLSALSGVRVSISCSAIVYDEGESSPGVSQQRTFYTLEAVACNGTAASCPDNTAATRAGYVERKSQATVVR